MIIKAGKVSKVWYERAIKLIFMTKYKRILISGQYFHRRSGGGITLSNLFAGWDKNKIAVVAPNIQAPSFDICDNYYQLGQCEFKSRFPFNLMPARNQNYSGLLSHSKTTAITEHSISKRKSFLRGIYEFLMYSTGLILYRKKFVLSTSLLNWLHSFKPEIIYSQLSSLEEIRIIEKLKHELKLPLVIHIMDDWPSTIRNSYFPKYIWGKIIEKKFINLITDAELLMGISEPMQDEYYIRYGLTFIPFHNPIDTKLWLTNCKKDYNIGHKNIVLLYSGRFGTGISNSLLEVANAIEELNSEGYSIVFQIQTPMLDHELLIKLRQYKCFKLNPVVNYEQIPRIFSNADILLLANDFDEKSITFLRYSMPTKAPEYMISGTPILVYASEETAIAKFFLQNKCGYCVTKENNREIKSAIRFLIGNTEYRKMIGHNAIKLALDKFDSIKVREGFLTAINDAAR